MIFLVPTKMDWPISLLSLPLIIENLGWSTANKGRHKDEKKIDWLGLWDLRNDVAVIL